MENKVSKSVEKNLNRAGRKAGVPNKVTQEFRETVRKLLENNAENVEVWLTQIAIGDDDNKPDPKGALDMLAKLAEFAAPKLARTEVVGDEKAPQRMVVSWKKY